MTSTAKYKQQANKKRRLVKFKVGDYAWAVLTKDHFSIGEYNKLVARKIEPLEIIEKINPNTYRVKLLSHIRTTDVFNVKHLIPVGDSNTNKDSNSRTNSFPAGRMMQIT